MTALFSRLVPTLQPVRSAAAAAVLVTVRVTILLDDRTDIGSTGITACPRPSNVVARVRELDQNVRKEVRQPRHRFVF
jgi:hypothetical protein